MPVRKFHSVEEMNQPVWRRPGDPKLYEAIRAVWDFGRQTSKKQFTPGVQRFRSIEEMDAAQRRIVRAAPRHAMTPVIMGF